MIEDSRLPLKIKFIEYFKKVPIQKYAGAYIGRSEDTITDWKKEDDDFSDQIELAKAEFIKEKLGKVRSTEWILERLFKDHFAQRLEQTGKDGNPVQVEILNSLESDYERLGQQAERQMVADYPPLQDQD